MPPKVGRPRNQKRKNLDEEHSTSWKCPVSVKRDSILNSKMIIDRRQSLRSSKRLSETGKTSLPISSREQSSASDGNQQPDDGSNTINSAYQVQGAGFDQVQSCSRYLVAVSHPLTVEPELRHDAENVENSMVGIPVKVEELGEAEMSLSNGSNQMAGQNNFEVESDPLEQEALAGEIQASKKFDEISNKYTRKCISKAGCSSPSCSLKLTAMAAIADEKDDDELDSETQSRPKDNIKEYQIKSEHMPVLRKIIGKHGDIVKNCTTKFVKFRSLFLEAICEIIAELDKKNASIANISSKNLEKKIDVVSYIKNQNVDVEWLHSRLTEILEARRILKQTCKLKQETDSVRMVTEAAERDLNKWETRKEELTEKVKEIFHELKEVTDKEADCKERLARAHDESTKISQIVKDAKSKVRRFLDCSLIDDLL